LLLQEAFTFIAELASYGRQEPLADFTVCDPKRILASLESGITHDAIVPPARIARISRGTETSIRIHLWIAYLMLAARHLALVETALLRLTEALGTGGRFATARSQRDRCEHREPTPHLEAKAAFRGGRKHDRS
jgi:hypothetical protein